MLRRAFRREPALWEPLKRGGPHKDRCRRGGRERWDWERWDWEEEEGWDLDKTNW